MHTMDKQTIFLSRKSNQWVLDIGGARQISNSPAEILKLADCLEHAAGLNTLGVIPSSIKNFEVRKHEGYLQVFFTAPSSNSDEIGLNIDNVNVRKLCAHIRSDVDLEKPE